MEVSVYLHISSSPPALPLPPPSPPPPLPPSPPSPPPPPGSSVMDTAVMCGDGCCHSDPPLHRHLCLHHCTCLCETQDHKWVRGGCVPTHFILLAHSSWWGRVAGWAHPWLAHSNCSGINLPCLLGSTPVYPLPTSRSIYFGIEVNNKTPRGPSSAVTQWVSVTAEGGPRGRNVLLLTSMPRELLAILPHFKFDDVAMSLYHIINLPCLLGSSPVYPLPASSEVL